MGLLLAWRTSRSRWLTVRKRKLPLSADPNQASDKNLGTVDGDTAQRKPPGQWTICRQGSQAIVPCPVWLCQRYVYRQTCNYRARVPATGVIRSHFGVKRHTSPDCRTKGDGLFFGLLDGAKPFIPSPPVLLLTKMPPCLRASCVSCDSYLCARCACPSLCQPAAEILGLHHTSL
ncbi:hypothetical protein VTK73DRAFT_686 [Phialemonium thermophilum]|uniref:Uncharacterized protein n=1 Tax=Phialemonium thermophilum TaxID=223376 RepID=A0ABR3VUG2_9PEZI